MLKTEKAIKKTNEIECLFSDMQMRFLHGSKIYMYCMINDKNQNSLSQRKDKTYETQNIIEIRCVLLVNHLSLSIVEVPVSI